MPIQGLLYALSGDLLVSLMPTRFSSSEISKEFHYSFLPTKSHLLPPKKNLIKQRHVIPNNLSSVLGDGSRNDISKDRWIQRMATSDNIPPQVTPLTIEVHFLSVRHQAQTTNQILVVDLHRWDTKPWLTGSLESSTNLNILKVDN